MNVAVSVDRTLLRVPEAAESLGISRSALYAAIRRGELPVIRIGRTTRVPAVWLKRWVEDQVAAWEQATTGRRSTYDSKDKRPCCPQERCQKHRDFHLQYNTGAAVEHQEACCALLNAKGG